MRNKRRYPRMTVRIEVRYQAGTEIRSDVATTLGAGGVFIATEDPIAMGKSLKLDFRLREGGVGHLIEGRVSWSCRQPVRGGQAGFGVQFTNAPAIAALAKELEDLAREGDQQAS